MRDIVFLSLAACLVAACAATGSGSPADSGPSNDPSDGTGRSPTPGDQPVPEGCGNGERTADEACDDGNTEDGDGCAADCLAVEPGYACTPPGTPCRAIARCGDGVVHGSEPCDDGDTEDGDGCSSRCKLEIGFKCEGEPSVCTETTCGDGVREGAEACDDGNTRPFDGCSARCQAEPDCAGGACSSTCGDGLVIDEGCDDGNSKDGDGCSSSCEVEEGFECAASRACDPSDPDCRLRVPVIYRDFEQSHPDFEVGCGNLTPGLVDTRLSSQGKPVLVQEGAACIQSADSFAQWYTDADVNSTIVDELWLYGNGEGGFVNRYGSDGEPWLGEETFTNIVHGGPGGTGCPQCTPSPQGQCFDPCTPWGDGNTQACCAERNQASYDGNPLFFPIDDAPNARDDARFSASVPAQYGYDGWPPEDEVLMNAREHNFHFTTEVVYWFEYDASSEAILDFLGDDDVWVFINGQLAVDLGGPHVPREGSVTIDGGAADILDLEDGHVYEIRVFHAERKTVGSSFKLTLAGFDTARSQCEPICGDGIVSLGEECDDGDNDGGYEECAEGCTLGPRCGDGIVQEDEDCDDGNRRDGDGCGSSCRELVLL